MHGLGCSHRHFLPSARALRHVARVAAPDLPGFGRTRGPVRALDTVAQPDRMVSRTLKQPRSERGKGGQVEQGALAAPLRHGGKRILRAVVGRLPEPVADRLRAMLAVDSTIAGRLRRALLTLLRHAGITGGVETFRLTDNPARSFVSADSMVLAQLYWFGEQGWEPELLGWWRHLAGTPQRSSSSA